MKIPLFDIDGTLIKSDSKIDSDAFKYAVKKVYGIDTDMDEISPEGMVDRQILVEVLKLKGLSFEKVNEKIDEENKTVEIFAKEHENEIVLEPLPGVLDLLSKLKTRGVITGILSGNVEGLAWTKLKKIGLRDFFAFGAFGSQSYKRADLVEIARDNASRALNRKVDKNELVIVGDTPRDIECARETDIDVVVVATGKYSFEQLEKESPNLLVHNLDTEGQKVLNFILND